MNSFILKWPSLFMVSCYFLFLSSQAFSLESSCGKLIRDNDYNFKGTYFYFYPEGTTDNYFFDIHDIEYRANWNGRKELAHEIYKNAGNYICLQNVTLENNSKTVKFCESSTLKESTANKFLNYTAKYCELFIDKFIPSYNVGLSGRSSFINRINPRFFLKVSLDKIDGNIIAVRFFGRINDHKYMEVVDAHPWFDSKDYFELSLFPYGLNLNDFDLDGAFYVETDKGIRYWANANNNPFENFHIDAKITNDISAKTMPISCRTAADSSEKSNGNISYEVEDVKKTAEISEYLNPSHCR